MPPKVKTNAVKTKDAASHIRQLHQAKNSNDINKIFKLLEIPPNAFKEQTDLAKMCNNLVLAIKEADPKARYVYIAQALNDLRNLSFNLSQNKRINKNENLNNFYYFIKLVILINEQKIPNKDANEKDAIKSIFDELIGIRLRHLTLQHNWVGDLIDFAGSMGCVDFIEKITSISAGETYQSLLLADNAAPKALYSLFNFMSYARKESDDFDTANRFNNFDDKSLNLDFLKTVPMTKAMFHFLKPEESLFGGSLLGLVFEKKNLGGLSTSLYDHLNKECIKKDPKIQEVLPLVIIESAEKFSKSCEECIGEELEKEKKEFILFVNAVLNDMQDGLLEGFELSMSTKPQDDQKTNFMHLLFAAKINSEARRIIIQILEKRPKTKNLVRALLNKESSQKLNPLFFGFRYNDKIDVNDLEVIAEYNEDLLLGKNSESQNIAHVVCQYCANTTVHKWLFNKYPDLFNEKDDKGYTPEMLAIARDDLLILKELSLDKKALPTNETTNYTLADIAAINGRYNLLLELHNNKLLPNRSNHNTPLHLVFMNTLHNLSGLDKENSLHNLEKFITAFAKENPNALNATNSSGHTPLELACMAVGAPFNENTNAAQEQRARSLEESIDKLELLWKKLKNRENIFFKYGNINDKNFLINFTVSLKKIYRNIEEKQKTRLLNLFEDMCKCMKEKNLRGFSSTNTGDLYCILAENPELLSDFIPKLQEIRPPKDGRYLEVAVKAAIKKIDSEDLSFDNLTLTLLMFHCPTLIELFGCSDDGNKKKLLNVMKREEKFPEQLLSLLSNQYIGEELEIDQSIEATKNDQPKETQLTSANQKKSSTSTNDQSKDKTNTTKIDTNLKDTKATVAIQQKKESIKLN